MYVCIVVYISKVQVNMGNWVLTSSLSTFWTSGLSGSTNRKAVMFVPPYLNSSRSTVCRSCKGKPPINYVLHFFIGLIQVQYGRFIQVFSYLGSSEFSPFEPRGQLASLSPLC